MLNILWINLKYRPRKAIFGYIVPMFVTGGMQVKISLSSFHFANCQNAQVGFNLKFCLVALQKVLNLVLPY